MPGRQRPCVRNTKYLREHYFIFITSSGRRKSTGRNGHSGEAMGTLKDISTIAQWEVKKSFTMMGRNVLPLAIVLFVLLVLVTGFTAQTGLHLQDGMYRVGVDDPQIAGLIASDARFTVYQARRPDPDRQPKRVRCHYRAGAMRRVRDGQGQFCVEDTLTGLRQICQQRLQHRDRSLRRLSALDRYPEREERTQFPRHPERPDHQRRTEPRTHRSRRG